MQNKNIQIEGLYRIKKSDLKKCADTSAKALINDDSSKYLLGDKLNYKFLYEYYLVIYKAIYNKVHIFSESPNIDGIIIISPMESFNLSLLDFFIAGGLKIILTQGIGIFLRSLAYEKQCIQIRENLVQKNTWYLFLFGVLPEKQGLGIGSKMIRPILSWLDTHNHNCYLETFTDIDVSIYEHYGFSIKNISKLQNTESNIHSMLRD